jgi:hypothetical protein
MGWGTSTGPRRYAATLAILVVTGALVGCGTYTLLPGQPDGGPAGFSSSTELRAAYAHVVPGETRVSQLSEMGFDSAGPNAETLSYLGIMDRFLPKSSAKFDSLSPAVQNCILASDSCTAYVFRAGSTGSDGSLLAARAAPARPAEVTFLIQDGRVAYKTLSGG